MDDGRIRFYGSLNRLLSRERQQWIPFQLKDSRSVKDLAESLGIPHTEIGDVIVNGVSSSPDKNLLPGDSVEVYPAFIDPDFPSEGIIPPAMPCRFILDTHLGTLAKHLRAMGIDILYDNSYEDEEIVKTALKEGRTILTRDRGILKRREVTEGYLIKSQNTRVQLREVFLNFDLIPLLSPLSRCLRCNEPLIQVPKEDISERLDPLTARYYNEFYLCLSCDRIYWKGGHWERITSFIEGFLKEMGESIPE